MAIQLQAESRSLGDLSITRLLPHREKKMVGPFIFFDRMGPAHFDAGTGIDVRPHPHTGLATLSYLFQGSMLHRDSLGSVQEIVPGDVNWMIAGRGVVHSERETPAVRATEHVLDGIQCWVALPESMERVEPAFQHVVAADLPCIGSDSIRMRVIAGEAYGVASPVRTFSRMFYLDVMARQEAQFEPPVMSTDPDRAQETAIYIVHGAVRVGGRDFTAGDFVLLEEGEWLQVIHEARFLMLGGEKFIRSPYISWNFVSHSRERIEQAIQQWREMRFGTIPGDDSEFMPLPER